MLTSAISRFNEKRAAGAESEADSGFTLIELMVVLLIMAILLAIAIPTFLGVKGGAQDRAAQSNLNTALTNAKAVYGNNQSYGTTSASAAASLTASEPSLTFNNASSTGQNVISVATDSGGDSLLMVAFSSAKNCWAVVTNETTGASATTQTAAGTYYSVVANTTPAACTASYFQTAGTWTQNSFPPA